ncbi:hypothetical protein [Nocardia sp. NPDC024068]|uniref:hypothetical protein n=1 Tax=Nocardia sp. NPDC024068 TaxID=3157197 RepID=UPI0033C8C749
MALPVKVGEVALLVKVGEVALLVKVGEVALLVKVLCLLARWRTRAEPFVGLAELGTEKVTHPTG